MNTGGMDTTTQLRMSLTRSIVHDERLEILSSGLRGKIIDVSPSSPMFLAQVHDIQLLSVNASSL